MTERLRELQRPWIASGAPDDEARWLLERVRRGLLVRRSLALAADSGSPGALPATGGPPAPSRTSAWFHGLVRWGRRPVVCVAVAAARHAYPHRSSRCAGPLDDREWVTAALDAAEACATSPTPEACELSRERGAQALEAIDESGLDRAEASPVEACAQAAIAASNGEIEPAWTAVLSARRLEGDASVVAAICEELVPWALGAFDPLVRWRTVVRRAPGGLA